MNLNTKANTKGKHKRDGSFCALGARFCAHNVNTRRASMPASYYIIRDVNVSFYLCEINL